MIKFSGGNNIKINKNMIVKHDVRMSAAIVFEDMTRLDFT